MSNPPGWMYDLRIDELTDAFVQCPACRGTGEQQEPASYIDNTYQAIPCRCCDGKGKVAPQRVCPHCGQFKSRCGHIVIERQP